MDKRKIKHLSKIKRFKQELSKVYNPEKIILFGSRAKNRHRRYSDFDFLIVSKKFGKIDKLERSSRMYDFWVYKYPAEFLCYTPEEFNKLKKQITIVREAVKEGIVI